MMNSKAKLSAIEDLRQHDGWKVLRECMEQELLLAAKGMASSATMTPSEMDFRRGAIFAASQMLDLPEKLAGRLVADVSIEEAHKIQKARRKDDPHAPLL